MVPITLNVMIGYCTVVMTFFAGLKYVNRLLHEVFDEGKMVLKSAQSLPLVIEQVPKQFVENGKYNVFIIPGRTQKSQSMMSLPQLTSFLVGSF